MAIELSSEARARELLRKASRAWHLGEVHASRSKKRRLSIFVGAVTDSYRRRRQKGPASRERAKGNGIKNQKGGFFERIERVSYYYATAKRNTRRGARVGNSGVVAVSQRKMKTEGDHQKKPVI